MAIQRPTEPVNCLDLHSVHKVKIIGGKVTLWPYFEYWLVPIWYGTYGFQRSEDTFQQGCETEIFEDGSGFDIFFWIQFRFRRRVK